MPTDHATHTGLTAAQVAERIARGETNDFRARVGRSYWQIFRDNVLNLFNIIFFTLLVVVIFLQDYTTALFAGFSVVTNSILGMLQEINAKRKLDQLAEMAAKDVPVWRDGQLTAVPARALVKDDVIPLEPGDRIVVDGEVLRSDSLEIDESQLTGESDAIFKDEGAELHSGSFCIAGSGLMRATRVGKDSTINTLSTIAKVYKNVKTPTQVRISALVQISVIVMLVIAPMLFLAGVLNGQPILEIVRSQVVFVSSIVPQGLVLTAILSLTIGAISITRFKTLIQRVNAVESMANVTVLCFDKTGTLTQNILTVSEIIPLNAETGETARADLARYTRSLAHQNRTAAAIAEYVGGHSPNGSAADKLDEIPFNSSRKWGAVVYQDRTLLLGAPERLLDPGRDSEAAARARELSAQGLRVLAFSQSAQPPAENGEMDHEGRPLALIVMNDQIRPDIQETLDSFRRQNVALKVISGDNLETVTTIASASGLEVRKAFTGTELDAMTDHELELAASEGNLFARIEPDTKRRIIAALKRQGAYVAMVGDGVNDVPALKEAHLAIAMNDGAQITKDVAEIVLLNNAMSTLPRAFEEGKAITQTIYGTTKLFLVKNFYNIALILFVGFMTLPFPTSPVQISWITFGTVNIPAGLIALKIIRPKSMTRFREDVIEYVIIAGTISAVNLATMYAAAYFGSGQNLYAARSAVTMFIGIWGTLIFWNIHGVELFEPRTMIERWRVTLLGLALAVFTLVVPFLLPDLFEFIPPTPLIWGLIIATFLLTAVMSHVFTRNRHLILQFWEVFKP